jgi:NADH:ubiquinone oxidoreductase subunit E
MNIKVCVGSSCHLKGSYDVIQALKDILKKYDVEDLVELQASFCLGHCAKGVNVMTDGIAPEKAEKAATTLTDGTLLLHNVTKDNAEEVFVKEIYPLIEI